MRLPQMTTSRWMKVVLVTAVALASGIQAERWWRLRTLHASALRDYLTSEEDFHIGRILVDRCVLASEFLMNARLLQCHTDKQRIQVITAHIARSKHLIEQGKRDELEYVGCGSGPDWTYVIEAQEHLTECEARLMRLKGSSSSLPDTGRQNAAKIRP
jgi:hypothetical protein